MDSRPFLKLIKERSFTLGCCNRPQAFLTLEEGIKPSPIGRLTNPNSIFLGSYIEAFDELQNFKYSIEPGCCSCLSCNCCGCCDVISFRIYNEKRSKVGRILKRKGGSCMTTDPMDSEYTHIEMPSDANERERALILGAALMFHQLHFDLSSEYFHEN